MLIRLAAAGLLATALAAPAVAAPPPPGPIAIDVIESWMLPRYRTLADATAAQKTAWTAACADGDSAADAPALKQSFQTASDAWSAVENVTTGPVSLSLRPDRIFFFPDRRNAVAKALTELAGRAKDGDISDDTLRAGSVAGQGFPALERLLYEPPEGEAAVRCRVGAAISGNLATLAGDVLKEWTAEAGPLAKLKTGQGDPVHFADPAQAAARLLTDLTGGVQRIVDVKLLPVLGSGTDAARPKAAEGWRSGRSARSVKVALDSLIAMAAVFEKAAPPELAGREAKAFAAARAAVAKLPDDVGGAAADPKRRRTVEAVVGTLKTAQADVVKDLAPALGIPLGFNALDGD